MSDIRQKFPLLMTMTLRIKSKTKIDLRPQLKLKSCANFFLLNQITSQNLFRRIKIKKKKEKFNSKIKWLKPLFNHLCFPFLYFSSSQNRKIAMVNAVSNPATVCIKSITILHRKDNTDKEGIYFKR